MVSNISYNFPIGGATDITGALNMAGMIHMENHRNVDQLVYLMTDGVATINEGATETVGTYLKDVLGIKIISVGLYRCRYVAPYH